MRRRALALIFTLISSLMVAVIPATPALGVNVTDCTGSAGSGVAISASGYWCFDGVPFNDTSSAEGLIFNMRAAFGVIEPPFATGDVDDYDYDANDTDNIWDDNHASYSDGDDRNAAEFLDGINLTGTNNDYADFGLDAVTVSLMGGFSGWSCDTGDPARGRPGFTAWEENGSGDTVLKTSVESRLADVIAEADSRDMLVTIQMFYQAPSIYPMDASSQSVLIDRVDEAFDDIAVFIDAQHDLGHKNILVEVANEISKKNYGFEYLDPPYSGTSPLDIIDALGSLQAKLTTAGVGSVPVSVSKAGGGIVGSSAFKAQVDWYSVHENSETNVGLDGRIAIWKTKTGSKPIVITEDDANHELTDQLGTHLAFTENASTSSANDGGQFAEAIEDGVSSNITIFGCESASGPGGATYTGTTREYSSGFQTLPVNWSPVPTGELFKQNVFFDMKGLTGGSGTPPPPTFSATELDAWDDENVVGATWSGASVEMKPGFTYVVAVNTADSRAKNGDVDLTSNPDAVSTVQLVNGSFATLASFSLLEDVGTWYGPSSTTERQRLEVWKVVPSSALSGQIEVDYSGSNGGGTVSVLVVEIAGTLAEIDDLYTGGQSFDLQGGSTCTTVCVMNAIDHAATGDSDDGHFSVAVWRDETTTVTPESGWASVSTWSTAANSSGPHSTLYLAFRSTYDSDRNAKHTLNANKRYAGFIAELNQLAA